VHGREVPRALLRVEVGSEDAAVHTLAPQELARPARTAAAQSPTSAAAGAARARPSRRRAHGSWPASCFLWCKAVKTSERSGGEWPAVGVQGDRRRRRAKMSSAHKRVSDV
jgi:hypothetical protein